MSKFYEVRRRDGAARIGFLSIPGEKQQTPLLFRVESLNSGKEAIKVIHAEDANFNELLEVIQPFYAFRGLVVASPVWYPNISMATRRKLFNFIKNVLEADEFDYKKVDRYLER